MKTSSQIALTLLSFLLFSSCASYHAQQQEARLSFPELGSIIQTKGQLWYATAEQVGTPQWEEPLTVTVQELPFNKASYATYTAYMAQASKINGIPYRDSLPYKPKYLRLQLRNKIDLVTRLNEEQNKEIREFLTNDNAYKIVTALDVSVPDLLMPQLLAAGKVVLKQDTQQGTYLSMQQGTQEIKVAFSELQVFDFGYASFCWGEDRYHHKRIETILTGDAKCPKGTFKKASKVTSDRSYLKF